MIVYSNDSPPLVQHGDSSHTNNIKLETLLKQRGAALGELRDQLLLAQDRMKKAADKKQRKVEFRERERVYLKIRPYRQKSPAKRETKNYLPANLVPTK